jgi:DNA (cytosine-5)-methyltransferase 1
VSYASLCSGLGAADLAAETLGAGDLAWYAEKDRDASIVMAARWPGVPNLGDLTAVEWERLERVDVLVAGYPCQGESLAGKRLGADDERWIWPHIACAIRLLRPRLVLLENVAAHLSLGFRTVLGDLASAGFDARWTTLRASDVGACHRRDRLFVVAYPVGCEPERQGGSGQLVGPEREREREIGFATGTASGCPCRWPSPSYTEEPRLEGRQHPEKRGGGTRCAT